MATYGVQNVAFPGTASEAEAFVKLEEGCGCEAATTWRGPAPCAFHRAVAGDGDQHLFVGQRLLIGLVCSRRRAAELLLQEGQEKP